MATLVPFMRIDLATPAACTLFATDAMGATEGVDAGGYGIVAQDLDHETVLACWGSSMQPDACKVVSMRLANA